MKEKPAKPKTGTWIVRQIPADLMRQARNYVDRYFSQPLCFVSHV